MRPVVYGRNLRCLRYLRPAGTILAWRNYQVEVDRTESCSSVCLTSAPRDQVAAMAHHALVWINTGLEIYVWDFSEPYTKLQCSELLSPFSVSDGGDAVGLRDQLVPSVTAMIKDIVIGIEDVV